MSELKINSGIVAFKVEIINQYLNSKLKESNILAVHKIINMVIYFA